jgi:hypothetical protein
MGEVPHLVMEANERRRRVADRLQAAALGQLLDLLKNQRGLVAGA